MFLFKSQTARKTVLENGVQICSLHINSQRPREFILVTLLIQVLFKAGIQHVELELSIKTYYEMGYINPFPPARY